MNGWYKFYDASAGQLLAIVVEAYIAFKHMASALAFLVISGISAGAPTLLIFFFKV